MIISNILFKNSYLLNFNTNRTHNILHASISFYNKHFTQSYLWQSIKSLILILRYQNIAELHVIPHMLLLQNGINYCFNEEFDKTVLPRFHITYDGVNIIKSGRFNESHEWHTMSYKRLVTHIVYIIAVGFTIKFGRIFGQSLI